MNVVGHNNEGVELKSAFFTMLEECCNEQFGIGCSLEVTMLLER